MTVTATDPINILMQFIEEAEKAGSVSEAAKAQGYATRVDLYWHYAELLQTQGELRKAADAYYRAAKAGKVRYPRERSAKAKEALQRYNALLDQLHHK